MFPLLYFDPWLWVKSVVGSAIQVKLEDDVNILRLTPFSGGFSLCVFCAFCG